MSTESAAHKGCFFMDIRRCYDLFLTDRRVSGCSESTLRFYEYVIGKLISYLTSTNSDSSVANLQPTFCPSFLIFNSRICLPAPTIACFVVFGLLLDFCTRKSMSKKRFDYPKSNSLIPLYPLLHQDKWGRSYIHSTPIITWGYGIIPSFGYFWIQEWD